MKQESEFSEMFVGLYRLVGGLAARYAVLDGIGGLLKEGQTAWSSAGIRQFLGPLQRAAGAGVEVTVGVLADDLVEPDAETAEVIAALRAVGLPLRLVEAWQLDTLMRSHKVRRRTQALRAQCLAQVLVLASCPPRALIKPTVSVAEEVLQ